MAYIVSYVFYVLTVYLKERKDSKNINEYAIPRTKNVIGDAYAVFNELAKKASLPNSGFPPTEQELRGILEKIRPNDAAPMVDLQGMHLNWIQYLSDRQMRSQGFIGKILDRMSYLDTELIKILTRIDDCDYFHQLDVVVNSSRQRPLNNTNMAFLTGVLLSYFEDIRDLEKLMESKYGEGVRYDDLFRRGSAS